MNGTIRLRIFKLVEEKTKLTRKHSSKWPSYNDSATALAKIELLLPQTKDELSVKELIPTWYITVFIIFEIQHATWEKSSRKWNNRMANRQKWNWNLKNSDWLKYDDLLKHIKTWNGGLSLT